jgi:hypothetical protein
MSNPRAASIAPGLSALTLILAAGCAPVAAAPATAPTMPMGGPVPMATAPAAAPPTASAETTAAGRAWIEAAAKRIASVEPMSRTGALPPSEILVASKEWLRACRESGMRGDELVTASRKHLDRAERTLELTKTRFQSGSVSAPEVDAVEAELAEARFWFGWAKDRAR